MQKTNRVDYLNFVDFTVKEEHMRQFFIIIAGLFIINIVHAADAALTDGQRKIHELNTKIEEKLNRGEQCNDNYFNENLLSLLKEVITRGQIWEDDKPVEGLPSFQSFLSSNIGNHSNPYFIYAWWRYTVMLLLPGESTNPHHFPRTHASLCKIAGNNQT